jgi:hypothetical protein
MALLEYHVPLAPPYSVAAPLLFSLVQILQLHRPTYPPITHFRTTIFSEARKGHLGILWPLFDILC